MRRSLFAFLLTLTPATAVMLAAPTPAHAQSDAALKEAQERFKEGLDLADAGKHEEARLKFQQAWSVYKSPSVLFNLARTEQLTGHDLEAYEHFRQFMKMGPDPKITDAERRKAAENVADLARKVGQIDIDVPAGSRVTVDSKVLEEVPREPVAVAPGRHLVECQFEGRIKSVTVETTPGGVTKARIVFESSSIEPPPPGGESPTPTGKWLVPTILGGIGLAGIGMGVGFGIASRSAKDEEDAARAQGICFNHTVSETAECANLKEKRDAVNTRATISTVSYIAGGVFLAGALVTYIVWPSGKPTTGSRVIVSPTAGGASLGVVGSF